MTDLSELPDVLKHAVIIAAIITAGVLVFTTYRNLYK